MEETFFATKTRRHKVQLASKFLLCFIESLWQTHGTLFLTIVFMKGDNSFNFCDRYAHNCCDFQRAHFDELV